MEKETRYLQNRLLPDSATPLFSQAKKFEELMMVYSCAIREVRTKLEVLNDELSVRYNRNPIEFIKTRVKKPLSIAKNLSKEAVR